jgi:hypothetical protein
MMTSALLTMLDTPEEAGAEHYQGYEYEEQHSSSQTSTPRFGPQYQRSSGSPNSPEDARNFNPGVPYMPPVSYYDQNTVLGIMVPRPQNRMESHYDGHEHIQKTRGQTTEDAPGWSPTWQGSPQLDGPLKDNAQSMPVVQHSQPSSNSPHGSSHAGLYLP